MANTKKTGNVKILERIQSNWNSHTPLVGMKSDTTTLKNSLAISYTAKHLPYSLAIMPGYLSRRNENISIQRHL